MPLNDLFLMPYLCLIIQEKLNFHWILCFYSFEAMPLCMHDYMLPIKVAYKSIDLRVRAGIIKCQIGLGFGFYATLAIFGSH